MSDIIQWIIVGVAVIASAVFFSRRVLKPKRECDGCCSNCAHRTPECNTDNKD